MKFTEMALNENLQKALKNNKFVSPTEVQQKTFDVIVAGRDVVVRSQTGSGKTFAFALPVLQTLNTQDTNTIQALVVCPTRELALQVANEIKKLASYLPDVRYVAIVGGSDMTRQIKSLKKKPQIVIGTPGRIMDHMRRRTLKLHELQTLVLDEADEMLNMGFKEDIETILKGASKQHQTLMFSATFPSFIKQITKEFMTNPVNIEVGQDNKSLSNIKQTFATVKQKDKKEALLEFFELQRPKHPIVFTNTKAMADNLQKMLSSHGMPALALHGEMRQSARKRVMQEMKKNKNAILVASDVAARGIDIDDIDYVINFDLPNNLEYFLHRIGRTGRAGKQGNAFTLLSSKDQLKSFRKIEKETNSITKEVILNVSFPMTQKAPYVIVHKADPKQRNKTIKDYKGNRGKRTNGKKDNREYGKSKKSGFQKSNSSFSKFDKSKNEKPAGARGKRNNAQDKYKTKKEEGFAKSRSNNRYGKRANQSRTREREFDSGFEHKTQKRGTKTNAFAKFEKPKSRKSTRKTANKKTKTTNRNLKRG